MRPLKFSKKINIFAVVFLLLIGISIGGYLVLKSKSGTASINQQLAEILEQGKQPVAGCQPNPNDKNKDSDNDGLMDWQEDTWQTNPCQPDTDKDGYLDGEEVASGYDPTTPAPNDELADRDPTKPRPLPNNLTQALAQSLSERMLENDMGSIDASYDTSDRVVNTAIQEVMTKAMQEFSLPNIPDQEIIISSDNSMTAVGDYARKVSETINQSAKETLINQEGLFESENQVFLYAIETKDFTEIDKQVIFYKKLYENIKQIPTPSDLKDIHKEQLGIFLVMSNIFKAVKEIDTDPIRANLALEQYKVTMDLSVQLSQEIISRLSNQ